MSGESKHATYLSSLGLTRYYLGGKTLRFPGPKNMHIGDKQSSLKETETERNTQSKGNSRGASTRKTWIQVIMTDQLIMNATMVRRTGKQRTSCVLTKTVLTGRPHSVVAPVSVSLFDGHRSVTRASRQRHIKPPAGQRGCGSETQLSEKAHRPRGGVPR